MGTKGIPLGAVEKAVSVRASRARARFRRELQARYGLDRLPTQAEIHLAAAGNALVAPDPGKVAREIEAADRACQGALRAAKATRTAPRPVPGVLGAGAGPARTLAELGPVDRILRGQS